MTSIPTHGQGKKRSSNNKTFAYKTIVHELGHALGVPHKNDTIMNRQDICSKKHTKAEACQISDQVIDFFISQYVELKSPGQRHRDAEYAEWEQYCAGAGAYDRWCGYTGIIP